MAFKHMADPHPAYGKGQIYIKGTLRVRVRTRATVRLVPGSPCREGNEVFVAERPNLL